MRESCVPCVPTLLGEGQPEIVRACSEDYWICTMVRPVCSRERRYNRLRAQWMTTNGTAGCTLSLYAELVFATEIASAIGNNGSSFALAL